MCLQGRAIATFRSRAQAHAAITRLHGRETLAGLRMRLFYLHEQQQRQHLLCQNPQSLITSVGQLSLDTPSPAVAAAAAALANHQSGGGGVGAAAGSVVGGQLLGELGGSRGGLQQQGGGGEGQQQQQQQGSESGTSQRSSFDKDQGPVVSNRVCGLGLCGFRFEAMIRLCAWCVIRVACRLMEYVHGLLCMLDYVHL